MQTSQLHLAIAAARDHAIITTDSQGVITEWSAGAAVILGWRATEAAGQPLGLIYTAEDRAARVDAAEMMRAVRDGSALDARWHVRRDGERVYLNGSVYPLRAADGALAGYVKIARDETERQRTELKRLQQLHDSVDFARLALTAVGGVGVWTYDVARDRYFCDAAIAKLYDIDPLEAEHGISRAGFIKNVHPDDKAQLLARLASGLLRPGDIEFEYRLCHADGSVHWVLSRGHTYFDENGHPVRRTGVGVDMTRQRLLEAQFRQSQKMEAVGQLTGGLAHDFNNLLAGITGSLEVLQLRIAQGRLGESERYLVAAQGAARRAAALTHRLLAFSRRQTLNPTPADVNRLIRGMEELVRRTVGPQISIDVACDPDLWPTLVDVNQLENALLNLCINARDAMPDGGRITIQTGIEMLDMHAALERDLHPGEYIMLCVTDTGTGMTPEVQARAFDPFFTTKPMGEGTGLGLSMIYGFVRQSGGQVRIDSKPGEGTTMCLYLPRHHADPVDALQHGGGREIPRGAGETVLVVDDEPTIRMLVLDVLAECGYAGLEAGDGAAGLRILQSHSKIDLLITDVGLPGGINGRQVADAGRSMHPDLKVLFITGYAESAVVGNGRLDKGMELITKPFAIDALTRHIRRMLEA